MNLTAIFTGIVAIAKVIPVIANQIDHFTELWITRNIAKLDRDRKSIGYERRVLMSKIQKCESPDERKALSTILSRISKL